MASKFTIIDTSNLNVSGIDIPVYVSRVLDNKKYSKYISSYEVLLVETTNIEVDDAIANMARSGGTKKSVVDEIADDFKTNGWDLSEHPIVCTKLIQTNPYSIQKAYKLNAGFHRTKAALKVKMSHLPTVIITFNDHVDEWIITEIQVQICIAENARHKPRNKQTPADVFRGMWAMVQKWPGDNPKDEIELREQRYDKLHQLLRDIVCENKNLKKAGLPQVPSPFKGYSQVKKIIDAHKVEKGYLNKPWNISTHEKAQEYVEGEYNKLFSVNGYGVFDQIDFSKRTEPYCPSSENDNPVYVQYQPSQAMDRNITDLLKVLLKSERDGLNTPLYVFIQASKVKEFSKVIEDTNSFIEDLSEFFEGIKPHLLERVHYVGILPHDLESDDYDTIINYQQYKQLNYDTQI